MRSLFLPTTAVGILPCFFDIHQFGAIQQQAQQQLKII